MSLCVLHHSRGRSTVRHCLFASTALLAIARVPHRSGMLQPTELGRVRRLASRLTGSGLHAWRSRHIAQETRQ
jgi:hypothetical protein